jgi:hypothetical protein
VSLAMTAAGLKALALARPAHAEAVRQRLLAHLQAGDEAMILRLAEALGRSGGGRTRR